MNIKELETKHQIELDRFVENCPHLKVKVEDYRSGFERTITIRCERCNLNLAGYIVNKSQSYMSYVRDCVSKYPGNVKEEKG